MNLVILDGRINSLIEKLEDRRRRLARFVLATSQGERIGVEVRGDGALKLFDDWEVGDAVQLRGHLTVGGLVAADIIRRVVSKEDRDNKMEQLSFGVIQTSSEYCLT